MCSISETTDSEEPLRGLSKLFLMHFSISSLPVYVAFMCPHVHYPMEPKLSTEWGKKLKKGGRETRWRRKN